MKGLASTHLASRPWRKRFLLGKTFDHVASGWPGRRVVIGLSGREQRIERLPRLHRHRRPRRNRRQSPTARLSPRGQIPPASAHLSRHIGRRARESRARRGRRHLAHVTRRTTKQTQKKG